MKNRPKLQTLKPRIQTSNTSRLQTLNVVRPGMVERKRGSAGVKDRQRIKTRDYGLCVMCQAAGRVSIGAVVDHRIPLWNGGSDEDDNKQTLCHPCHDEKTALEACERAGRGW
jgi:5-methylcytosine-specific restriction protein A